MKSKQLIPRRLFVDIETSPNICLSWRVGRKISIDSENIISERKIICIAYKWQGDERTQSVSWSDDQCDKEMLARFIPIANRADEIVAHNGDRFDIPWIKTRAIFHSLPPLPNWKTVDTLQWCKRRLLFNSNRLDYIGKYLGVGGKIKTKFNLWRDVLLNKSKPALKSMTEYCRRDVELLERVWERIESAGCVKTHSGVLHGLEKWSCPKCGSEAVHKRKTRITASGTVQHQMQCNSCGRHYSISDAVFDRYTAHKK